MSQNIASRANPIYTAIRKSILRTLKVLGLDHSVRKIRHSYKKMAGEVVQISIGRVQAEYVDYTLLNEELLKTEKKIIDDIVDSVKEGDVFYDIGADAGLYTCLVSKAVSDQGTVVAFEPHPTRKLQLIDNLHINNVSAEVRTEALSDEEKKGVINYSLKTKSGEVVNVNDDKGHGNIVNIVRGDTIVEKEKLPTPDVIKIDVEGAELRVLKGFRKILSDVDNCMVYIELHDEISNFGGSKSEVLEFLRDINYEVELLETRETSSTQEFLKATK
ncbi:FkbM family methyltransferase [Salinibacter ruber]|uniref:FkbM family methyltransferase n=1 Tax=Salinibacter ruber TaxID=146919 RepID=UPI0021688C09|nr:FkbM family methyltransferase [Salinibacter ruber]MCS3749293.1 FkbM family methyltransferase [Salinibacter ruber]